MHPITKEKLRINMANAWRMWSNWVMGASGIAFSAYLTLAPEQQQSLVSHLPVAPWLVPILATVGGIAARLWPQHSITAAVAAAKSVDSPQPPELGPAPGEERQE